MPGMKNLPLKALSSVNQQKKVCSRASTPRKLYACNGVDDKGEAGQRMGLTLILQDDIQF